MHPGSCKLARYNIAAGNQNKYWEMNDILFEKKPKNDEEILKYAKEAGFDTEKLQQDANSEEVKNQLNEEIDFALKNNLNATPVLQIGMRILPGVRQYDELEAMIIEAGAQKR